MLNHGFVMLVQQLRDKILRRFAVFGDPVFGFVADAPDFFDAFQFIDAAGRDGSEYLVGCFCDNHVM